MESPQTPPQRRLNRKFRERVPFSLSGLSKWVLISFAVLGPIYALLLLAVVAYSWLGGPPLGVAAQVAYLVLAAEMFLCVPLLIIALVFNAQKGLDRDRRMKRMSGIGWMILIWVAVFIATCIAAIFASTQVMIIPGGGAIALLIATWQDLKSWRKFREFLAKQAQAQAQEQPAPAGDSASPGAGTPGSGGGGP